MSRSLESFELLSLEEGPVEGLLRSCLDAHDDPGLPMTSFNGFPTAMLLRPTAEQPGSLHYMFFPARASQEFHRHPGGRYILLVGDVPMHVHYSEAPPKENPADSCETLVIPARTFAGIRMPPEMWHRFETSSETGAGVFAITFHDDDEVDPTAVQDDLMEEATFYWPG